MLDILKYSDLFLEAASFNRYAAAEDDAKDDIRTNITGVQDLSSLTPSDTSFDNRLKGNIEPIESYEFEEGFTPFSEFEVEKAYDKFQEQKEQLKQENLTFNFANIPLYVEVLQDDRYPEKYWVYFFRKFDDDREPQKLNLGGQLDIAHPEGKYILEILNKVIDPNLRVWSKNYDGLQLDKPVMIQLLEHLTQLQTEKEQEHRQEFWETNKPEEMAKRISALKRMLRKISLGALSRKLKLI